MVYFLYHASNGRNDIYLTNILLYIEKIITLVKAINLII